MPFRRAAPILALLLAPALGGALAAQQDPLASESSVEAIVVVDPADAPLIAWPCLDGPGCADGPAMQTPVLAGSIETSSATAIPLPAALGLMALGLTALGLMVRRGG